MSRLITLDRQHPDFDSYLRGTFSRQQRALPLKSLNVHTESETVTFQLTPLSEIKRPSWLMVWGKALRPTRFLLVLMPMFLVLSHSLTDNKLMSPELMLLACLGLVLLFAGLLLRNDFQDHMSGADRIRSDRGSRAIQNGWLTAQTLLRVSWVFCILSLLCALPIFILLPETLWVALPAALVGAWAFFRKRSSFKDVRGGQIGPALMAGPLLTMGLQTVATGVPTKESFFLGFLWSWLMLWPVHLRDLEHLIVEGQSGRGSLVGLLGFDRAQTAIRLWWVAGLLGFTAYHFRYGGRFWMWVFLFILSFLTLRFASKLHDLRSPAGSAVALIRRHGEILFSILVMLWILESLWQVGL